MRWGASRAHLAGGRSDMRCGLDRLVERVQVVIGENPLSGHLFVSTSTSGIFAPAPTTLTAGVFAVLSKPMA